MTFGRELLSWVEYVKPGGGGWDSGVEHLTAAGAAELAECGGAGAAIRVLVRVVFQPLVVLHLSPKTHLLFRKLTSDNRRGQFRLIVEIENLWAEERLLESLSDAFYKLYRNNLLDGATFLDWYEGPLTYLARNAAPFLTWLRLEMGWDAEEEEDDKDDGLGPRTSTPLNLTHP